MQGWERAINTLSVRRPPTPQHQPIEWKKRKGNSRRQKVREQLVQYKGIGPALETSQSHTIQHGVTKIVPQRYYENNKSPVIVRGGGA